MNQLVMVNFMCQLDVGHGVPRYLVKHCSRCVCEFFSG